MRAGKLESWRAGELESRRVGRLGRVLRGKPPLRPVLSGVTPPPPSDPDIMDVTRPEVTKALLEEQIAFIRVEKCREEGRTKLMVSARDWPMPSARL